MPVQSMNCPKCGGRASEYAPNKWQCLKCQSRFIYEPPPEDPVPDEYVVHKLDSDRFRCSSCGGTFSELAFAKYHCKACGAVICNGCAFPCRDCSAVVCRKHAAVSENDWETLGTAIRCRSCQSIYNAKMAFAFFIIIIAFIVFFAIASSH